MTQEKLGTFKVDASLWDSFIARAKQEGTNGSTLLKSFIAAYLDGRIDSNQLQNIDSQKGVDPGLEQRLSGTIANLEQIIAGIDDRLGK
jgi:uncharacterized membrane protein YebE (DUF533 family)